MLKFGISDRMVAPVLLPGMLFVFAGLYLWYFAGVCAPFTVQEMRSLAVELGLAGTSGTGPAAAFWQLRPARSGCRALSPV